MPDLTPTKKPVLAVALNRRGGDAALRRVLDTGVPVVLLAERGFPVPEGLAGHIEVPTNRARVGRAVREARRHDASWVAVPRTMGTADYLLSAVVRSVGKHVDAEHPGMAMLVAAEHGPRDPSAPRALAVVDLDAPGGSGWGVLAAVQLAAHSGASLDIVVVGAEHSTTPTSTEEWLSLVPLTRSTDLVHQALDLASSHDVAITWLPIAGGRPVDTVSSLLDEGRYDVVVDDLGGHRLRKRVRASADVRRLLDDPAHGAVLRHVLGGSTTDVVVVVDGITLGLVPAVALRTGAAAALAMGAVGLAAPVAAQTAGAPGPVVAQVAAATPATSVNAARAESSQGGSRSERRATEPKKKASSGQSKEHKKTGTKAKEQKRGKAATKAETVTAADVSAATAKAAAAKADAQAAARAQRRAESRLERAAAAVQQAEAQAARAREQAQPAADRLAEARLEFGQAEKARIEAERQREAAEQRANVIMAAVTAGRVVDEAEQAADEQRAAEQAATLAESRAAAEYEEYLRFAEHVEAAERALTEADDAAKQQQARLVEKAREAQSARTKATRLDRAAAQVQKAWTQQGLHRPATGRVTSVFGPRVHPVTGVYKLHTGVDFAGTDGKYYAAEDGVVTYAGYDGAYGYMVKVNHGRIDGHRVVTWYAHQPGLQVSVGQTVQRGEVIGRIGNTGYSTGPHAHVELRIDGQPVDIVGYLR